MPWWWSSSTLTAMDASCERVTTRPWWRRRVAVILGSPPDPVNLRGLTGGAHEAAGQRARALAEQVRAGFGQLARVAESPQGPDRADAVRLGGGDVEAPIADHHRAVGPHYAGLQQMREQLRLAVEAAAGLGTVDAVEVPRQPEVGDDARGREPRLGGDHQPGVGQARGGLEHLGHAVVDRILEEADGVVARPVVADRGL